MSILERIRSRVNFIIENRVTAFFIYRRLYRNYLNIIFCILRKKYPIEAFLRNGSYVTVHDHIEIMSLTYFLLTAKNHRSEVEYDIKEDKTTFLSLPYSNNNPQVTLYGGITNSEAVGIFLDNIYENLPVVGKTVVDIGANIADSSIYFAIRGAKKVIGLEPFPKNYEMARRNVESNNLSDKITLLLAGCAGNQGFVTISPFDKAWVGSSVKNSSQGIKVPMLTLEDILKQNNLQSGENILKMDCEGCEYESILSASRDTIRSFSYIQIEYHYGYKDLKYKLEENGFVVSISKPKLIPNTETGNRMYIGNILAILA